MWTSVLVDWGHVGLLRKLTRVITLSVVISVPASRDISLLAEFVKVFYISNIISISHTL